MIVGIDATTLKGRLSGVGYYTARLIDSLANGAGEGTLERLVVLSNQDVPLPEAERLHVHEGGRFRVRSLWMQLLLPGILEKLRPDLVHFTNYLAPAACRVPYVLSIHDMSLQLFPECHTWKKRLLTSRLLPLVAERARLVLVPSESTRRDVVRLLGLDPAKVRVIPYAAGPAFRPVPPDHERMERLYGVRPPYFLYVGTLEPRKNLERFLRAFASALPALPRASLVLVGQRGWKFAATLREAARGDLQGRVVMPGYVPEEDLPALMSGALAFVYPSLYEGFGLPVVEAMACGTPVMTSRSSSLSEIADGAALLVDPHDEAAMAEGLRALAGDAALRGDLAARGRERAALFSWDRTGRETVAAYREAVGWAGGRDAGGEYIFSGPAETGLSKSARCAISLGPVSDAVEKRCQTPGPPAASPLPTRDPDEAILRTVTYASLFEAPLTRAALRRSLMDVALDDVALERRLDGEPLRSLLGRSADCVYPLGREEWLGKREVRRAHTRELLQRYRRALVALQHFPYVRLVALSGACAHENASDDDVDVFLVVREGRAWAVTLVLMLLSKLMGLRRALCLNYTLDEGALRLPERDLFTAAELVGIRPLAGRPTYLRLVESNAWLMERFPNFGARFEEWSRDVPERAGSARLEQLFDLGPAQGLERVARALLGAYLGFRTRGAAGVRLEPGRLKLHTRDHGPRLRAAFEKALADAREGEA